MRFFYLLFLLVYGQVYGQQALDNFLKLKSIETASVGFEVYNISTQKLVSSHQAKKLLSPASLQKLYTSATALAILGRDYRYQTNINLKGSLESNIFKGVLEIEASGDPSVNSKFINAIYSFFKEKKIQKFEGYVIVNQSHFSKIVPQTWLVEDVANYYGSPAFGFNYLDNTYKLTFAQSSEGTLPKIVKTVPYMRNLYFENKLVSKGKKDKAYIIGLPFSNRRQIVGSIPAGTRTFSIKGAVDNPAQLFKNELLKKFREEEFDFVFNPKVVAGDLFASKKYISQPITDLVAVVNQNSNNLYAEALLKTIGLQQYGLGSTENGLRAIEESYTLTNAKMYDGSGLSRKNRLSAKELRELLVQNASNKDFVNSLGVSGVSGTLKYLYSVQTKGKIKGKSGSADGILNYAGYFKNSKGEQLAFVIMINNFTGSKSAMRKEILKLLEACL